MNIILVWLKLTLASFDVLARSNSNHLKEENVGGDVQEVAVVGRARLHPFANSSCPR